MALERTYPYSVRAASVAAFNRTTESYGTPVATTNIQSASFDPEHDTDSIRELGRRTRMLSVPMGATMTLTFAGFDWDSLAIMTGISSTDSGSGASAERDNKLVGGGSGLPYFGLILAMPADEGQEVHLHLPWVKLEKAPPLDPEQNQFAIPEIDAMIGVLVLNDGTAFEIVNYKVYGQETTIPTDFDTAFGLA